MNDLMTKLAMSKKIMDIHNNTPRSGGVTPPVNINESQLQQPITENNNISNKITLKNDLSENAILNSKLPDEIKKLMLENPISKPEMNGPVLSDDIIEGASRLMNTNKPKIQENNQNIPNSSDLKQMIRDVVRDTVRDVIKEELQNAGMLMESSKKTNETLSLRVGKHIFEGKISKIKKINQ